MQGPRIAANEQPAALDKRLQLREIELPNVQHPFRRWTQRLPGGRPDSGRRFPIRWPRAQHDPPIRRPGGQARHQ